MTVQAEIVSGRREYAEAVEQLFAGAKRKICLFSQSLHPALYATRPAVEHLREWAAASSRSQALILIQDPRQTMTRANRLVNLGLQLSSSFEFRDARAAELAAPDQLIIDERHLLKQSSIGSYDAALWLDAPLRSREALRDFSARWEEATPSIEIRRQSF